MKNKGITARVCAFSRAYHSLNNRFKIFDDYVAKDLLNEEEYTQISINMTQGIKYFNPSFVGSDEEALRWIVDNQLSPTLLGRGSFTEKALENSVAHGTEQYLIFGAGYDTFAYRQPNYAKDIEIFEIDYPATSKDKVERIKNARIKIHCNTNYIQANFTEKNWERSLLDNHKFDKNKISFSSLLGLSYYLTKEVFSELISIISSIAPSNSSIVFDYPDINYYKSKEGSGNKHSEMAAAANERMLASYSYNEIVEILNNNEFTVTSHLTPLEITEKLFKDYNLSNPPYKITAQENVNYCYGIKR